MTKKLTHLPIILGLIITAATSSHANECFDIGYNKGKQADFSCGKIWPNMDRKWYKITCDASEFVHKQMVLRDDNPFGNTKSDIDGCLEGLAQSEIDSLLDGYSQSICSDVCPISGTIDDFQVTVTNDVRKANKDED